MTASDNQSVTISVRVTPRASRSEVVGVTDETVKVRLSAPPVDGAANAELIKLLAKALRVSKSSVEIVAGAASRNKIVRIAGLGRDELARLLTSKIG